MTWEPIGAEDTIAIHQLMSLYGHVADGVDGFDFDGVFIADAVFDASAVNAGRHEGIERIRAFFALGKPPHPPAHQFTNAFVFRRSGEVKALSKFVTLNVLLGVVKVGDYNDTLLHTPGGMAPGVQDRVATALSGEWPDRRAARGAGASVSRGIAAIATRRRLWPVNPRNRAREQVRER